MSKFKVGDRVMVIGTISGTVIDVKSNGVVVECDEPSKGVEICQYPNKMVLWPNESQVELIAPNRYELHITCNDGKTTNAVYKVNGKIEKRTEAVCAPSDTFNFATGAQTAFDRVFPKAQPSQPIAPQEDKPRREYKIGDKVVFNSAAKHERFPNFYPNVGTIGTVVGVYGELLAVQWEKSSTSAGDIWAISTLYVEPYAEPEQPKLTVTRDMLEKLGACSGGLIAFDRLFPSGTTDYDTALDAARKDFDCRQHDYNGWLLSEKPQIEAMQNEQPKEPIKLYCVKDNKGTCVLIKDKIYEFVCGNSFPYEDSDSTDYKYDSFEEYARKNPTLSACLVPLVKRPALVGEWVLLTNVLCASNYGNGEIYKVSEISVGKPVISGKTWGTVLLQSEYLVLDNYQPEPQKEPEPVYYSGEVVCVDRGGSRCFTQYKGYEFKNGIVIDDDGDEYNSPCKTLHDFNNRSLPQFIPYLGEA